MIKTLRITSIIAVVLAGGLLVFPAIFGLRSDKEIEEFLNLPSVVEKFRQDRGDKQKTTKDEISPLVAAAQAFGKYLNPPATPRPVPRRRDKPPTRRTDVLPPPPTATATADSQIQSYCHQRLCGQSGVIAGIDR